MRKIIFTLLFIFSILSTARAVVEGGLVGYWSFDNSAVPVEGKVGGAQVFNGSSSVVSVPHFTNLDGSKQASISFWIKANGASGILNRWGAQRSLTMNLGSGGSVQVNLRYGGSAGSGSTLQLTTSTGAVAFNQWQHIVLVFNASSATATNNSAQIYVNGNLLGSHNNFIGALNSAVTDPLQIGYSSSGLVYMNGALDDLRIYNRALSLDEILVLHGGPPAPLNTSSGGSSSGGASPPLPNNDPSLILSTPLYVSIGGDDSNPGTKDKPFKSIQKCANVAGPGSTCFVNPGNYPEHVLTKANGGDENTRITFKAEGKVVMQGFDIKHGYVTVDGFDITGSTSYQQYIGIGKGGDHCQILHNTIYDGSLHIYGIQFYSSSSDGSVTGNNCLIKGNTFKNLGYQFLSVDGVGHRFENNTFESGGGWDLIRLFGHDHVFYRNIFRNSVPKSGIGNHPDFLQTFSDNGGESYNMVFEENWIEGLEASMDTGYQLGQMNSGGGMLDPNLSPKFHDYIFRRNVFANVGNNWNLGMPGMKFENNTFYRSAYTQDGLTFGGSLTRGDSSRMTIINNAFVEGGKTALAKVDLLKFGIDKVDPIIHTLIQNGYIEASGRVKPKLLALNNSADMIIDSAFNSIKSEIFNILKTVVNGKEGGYYGNSGAELSEEVLREKVTFEKLINENDKSPVAKGILNDLSARGYTNPNGRPMSLAKSLMSAVDAGQKECKADILSQLTVSDIYLAYKSAICNVLLQTVQLDNYIQNTMDVNYNFVAGPQIAGFPAKRSDNCTAGVNTPFRFCEPNGVNGGDPKFQDPTNPAGIDGIPLTIDDGLKPKPGSPLCGKGKGGVDIGMYSCDPGKVFATDHSDANKILARGLVNCAAAGVHCVGASQEYATIKACAAVAQPGETCVVFPGNYPEHVDTVRSGKAGGYITFQAAYSAQDSKTTPEQRATMKGFRIKHPYIAIHGFDITQYDVGLDQAHIVVEPPGDHVRITDNVFRDGIYLYSDKYYFDAATRTIKNPEGGFLAAGFVSDITVYLTSNINHPGYNHDNNGFKSGDRARVTKNNVKVQASPSNSSALIGEQKAEIMGNVLEGPVTSEGTVWFKMDYDTGADGWTELKYLYRFDVKTIESVTDTTITLKPESTLFTEGPVKATVYLNKAEKNGVWGVMFNSTSKEGVPNDGVVEGNKFYNLAGKALWIQGSNHLVENNTWEKMNGWRMLSIYGSNNIFRYNVFKDSKRWPDFDLPAPGMIFALGSGSWDMYDTLITSTGSVDQKVNDNVFEYNFIKDVDEQFASVEQTAPGGATALENKGLVIKNNVFVGMEMNGSFSRPETLMINNTFYRNAWNASRHNFVIGRGGHGDPIGSRIKNNIFVGCGSDPNDPVSGWYSTLGEDQKPSTDVKADYNFVAGPASSGYPSKTNFMAYGHEEHGINGGNPGFVNVADPLGPDGIAFSHDDGLRLVADSILCKSGENQMNMGAYSCKSALINKEDPPMINAGDGDVSVDGKISIYDAALVLRYTLGSSLNDVQKQKADINGDGKIDGADVVGIARKAMGL